MKKNIAVLPGDGIGPEIIATSIKVLKKIAHKFNHQFDFTNGLIGHAAITKTGKPLPAKTIDLCLKSDAVLFGAIGDPIYDNNPNAKVRPEQGLLKLRKSLNLFANIRPIITFPTSSVKSPLKPEIIKDVDFIVIRELTNGIYFGRRGRNKNNTSAYDTSTYTKEEILRVSKVAFELAMNRKKKVTLVDKANVLETSRLWRETVKKFSQTYPEIRLDFMFVDNASMQIIKSPREFDVILTDNMFGDILTDEASVITGSIGMLPSASIGERTSLFEPIHGSFPKAKGLNVANPVGTILSAAMMLEYAFNLKKEAETIRSAIKKVLDQSFGTKDIVAKNPLSTSQMGDKIAQAI